MSVSSLIATSDLPASEAETKNKKIEEKNSDVKDANG